MNEVKFSGISAFSYVWNKNKEESYLHRFCSALAAGIVGFCFGYKVNIDEVKSVLIQHERAYFNTEYKKELAERHIKVNNPALRYETDPHTGVFYGERLSIEEEKYTTKDVEGAKDQKIVEVKICNRPSAFIKYDHVTTNTNKEAFCALGDALDLHIVGNQEQPVSYEDINKKVRDQYDVSNNKELPGFIFIKGEAEKQHEYVKNESKDHSVVVFNASQINYQEQIHADHNIKNNIKAVYEDPTFGPATVKTEIGGVEFLTHTLIKGNAVEFSGAYCNFFRDARAYKTDLIHADGGYYFSDLDENEWKKLGKELINSDTKAEGFFWGTATKDQDQDKKWEVKGKTIYQTGAINAKQENNPGSYDDYHRQVGPHSELQFSILFLQMRNALMHETNTKDSVVVHTTSIGGGVFRNKEYVSMIALQAAILSLPSENREKVKNVYFGSFNEESACREFGNKTAVSTSTKAVPL